MADKAEEGFKLTVSADDVRGFIQEALTRALVPAERDRLIAEAIRKLMEGNWQEKAEISRVFASAVSDVARKLAAEEFAKPENLEKLRRIVAEAWEKTIIGEKRAQLVDKVGEAISRGVFGDRY